MVFLRLTRKSGDQSCTQYDIRNLLTELSDNIDQFLFGSTAAHSFKNSVRCVLDRNIQIMTDLLLITNGFDQFIVNLLRITIKDANPTDTSDLTELL